MGDSVTIDIEYLRDELSKAKIMLPRMGFDREETSLYDILAYMTSIVTNVYLIKLKDGRYRVANDLRSTLFENNTEVEAFYDMIMSLIKNDEDYYITPPKKPSNILSCFWEEIYGHLKPRIRYVEL